MSTTPAPSIVVFASDVTRMARFYQEVGGMTPIESASDLVVLEGAGFQVVVHGIPKTIAASIRITEPPTVREDTPIKLCLPVGSIDDARRAAQALGGRVGPKAREWEARGFRACDGYDPEGNVFQVRESAR
ncbi:MAG: VOC family protein [Vicinamibacterales bacterium]